MRLDARDRRPAHIPIPPQRAYVVTLADGREATVNLPADWDEARVRAFLADARPALGRFEVRPEHG